jgi:hypothetical protein
MLEKGVIREIVEWKTSRIYFYWRLKRRLSEINAMRYLVGSSTNSFNDDEARNAISIAAGDDIVNSDRKMVAWLADENNLKKIQLGFKKASLAKALADIIQDVNLDADIKLKMEEIRKLVS